MYPLVATPIGAMEPSLGLVMLLYSLCKHLYDDSGNEEDEIVCAIEEQQLDNLPLKGKNIKEATKQDPVLSHWFVKMHTYSCAVGIHCL